MKRVIEFIEDSLTDEESCIEQCVDELENSKGIYIDEIHTEWDSESQGLRYNDDYEYEEGF